MNDSKNTNKGRASWNKCANCKGQGNTIATRILGSYSVIGSLLSLNYLKLFNSMLSLCFFDFHKNYRKTIIDNTLQQLSQTQCWAETLVGRNIVVALLVSPYDRRLQADPDPVQISWHISEW